MGGRGLPQSRQEAFPSRSAKQAEYLFQREDAIAASDVDHRGSGTYLTLTEPAEATNSHASQPLSGLQAIDLGGIEGQARQGRAPQRRGEIASPALLLQAPALFEFPIGIILNV